MNDVPSLQPGAPGPPANRAATSPGIPLDAHPALLALGQRFERRGVRWCALEDPPAYGGALRVLLEPHDRRRAERIVLAAGGIVVPSAEDRGQWTWLLRDPRSGSILVVQVLTQLHEEFGARLSRQLVWGILLNRIGEVVPRVAPADRFWLLLAGRRRGAGRPLRSSLATLTLATPVGSSPLAGLVGSTFGPNWPTDRIVANVERFGELPFPRRRPAAILRSRLRRARSALERRTPRLGLTVAVHDPQRYLKAVVASSPPSWPYPLDVSDVAPVETHRPSVTHLVGGYARSLWRVAQARAAARRGNWLLLDRHPLTASLHPSEGAARAWRAMTWLVPRPDAILVVHPANDHRAGRSIPSTVRGRRVFELRCRGDLDDDLHTFGRCLWEMLAWHLAGGGAPARRP